MKKTLIFFSLLFQSVLMFSCAHQETAKSHLVTINGQTMLVGKITQDELFRDFPVFKDHYDSYRPADSVVTFLKYFSQKVTVEVFLGTWCGDTQEYLPPFLKLFSSASNPKFQIILHAVDRKKKDPDNRSDFFKIQRIPTLVFLHQNKEFARFVETPELSVEEDLMRLLRQCP